MLSPREMVLNGTPREATEFCELALGTLFLEGHQQTGPFHDGVAGPLRPPVELPSWLPCSWCRRRAAIQDPRYALRTQGCRFGNLS